MPRPVLVSLLLLGATMAASIHAAEADQLARGKALYEGPGGCFACHQNNGKGVSQVFPPLAQSDWVKGSPERIIHITRHGLEGPLRVNGKTYNGFMPPQAQFSNEQIADILTYVRGSWGNKSSAITTEQVAAVKSLGDYGIDKLLNAYPFEKSERKKNGKAKLNEVDALIDPTKVTVRRIFMPGASPAAIAVALPGPQYYCWDAGECRLRYAWKTGGFITGNKSHWYGNGQAPPIFSGTPYYRSRNSLIKESDIGVQNHARAKDPKYDTTQSKDFPLQFKGIKKQLPKYKGYTLVDTHPEFIYQYGDQTIHERITTRKDLMGIDRHFKIEGPPRPISFQLAEAPKAEVTCAQGKVTGDAILIPAGSSRNFTISIKEIAP